jgi:CheY-like chemotaxis protein
LCVLITEYLAEHGYQVQASHDGRVGLARALAGEYDLIAIDVILPVLDGFDLLRPLHGLGHVHHPRVPEGVTRFMQVQANELEPAVVAWLEQCRDGTVM